MHFVATHHLVQLSEREKKIKARFCSDKINSAKTKLPLVQAEAKWPPTLMVAKASSVL